METRAAWDRAALSGQRRGPCRYGLQGNPTLGCSRRRSTSQMALFRCWVPTTRLGRSSARRTWGPNGRSDSLDAECCAVILEQDAPGGLAQLAGELHG